MKASIDTTPEGNLVLWFPPTQRGGKGHHVQIPATAEGMQVLVSVLQARRRLPRHQRTISSAAAPTQHQIKEWLKAMQPKLKMGVDIEL